MILPLKLRGEFFAINLIDLMFLIKKCTPRRLCFIAVFVLSHFHLDISVWYPYCIFYKSDILFQKCLENIGHAKWTQI